ncbi:MAG: Uncharacterized protein FD165_2623 [Gammaproteobacteria bacterium]|nr:MAG: Uncharacterized protein FD165_2623 [Gammaproteobacteria bacterium]TND01596.1 MAG: Uncharacterized protein FD120_2544 [Gammaproteobacteria bacterium]
MTYYHEHYTWSHPLTEAVIAHTDGAVSLLVEWGGFDSELLTASEREQQFTQLYQLLNRFERGYVFEFHLWREYDNRLAAEYLEKGKAMVRGEAIAAPLREDIAQHLGAMAMSNRVGLVITHRPTRRPFFVRRQLVHQSRDALALVEYARGLLRYLPAARIASVEEYAQRVQQSFYRPAFSAGHTPVMDARYALREQWVREIPEVKRAVAFGDAHTKVLFFYMYPNATPAWFTGLAAISCPMHVVQIVEAVDTKDAMRKTEAESDMTDGLMSRRGRDYSAKGLNDLAAFRQFVAEHNLRIYRNAYIVHLHGTLEQVDAAAANITDWVENHDGQVRAADYIQLAYFRAAQPGQGYRSPMFRPDDTWQVADMLPVQVYRTGERYPESLRLGVAGQLIGFNYTTLKLSHAFTGAKTGMGKGVDKVATILETYPFGIDWYIAEIGESYRWIVESFGGIYSKVDPNTTVINPLPPYALASSDPSGLPLDATLAGSTVQALAFLLADGKTALDVHQEAAAQTALQLLYAAIDDRQSAPTIDQLLVELEDMDNFTSAPQQKAAKAMAENLDSFLNTTEGRLFACQDNLLLSDGITGVDLKDVDKASPKLLKFYLVFLSLRFSHMAFARRRPARVLLDELHKFVAIAPEVVGRLISELARMGRKDNASIDLVTQGITEIDAIESEVLNSIAIRSLMYREDEHDHIAQRLNMKAGALQCWRSYPYPMNFPWRPSMRSVGDEYFDLYLTFPQRVLNLANTDPTILDLKSSIGLSTRDPLERLLLLQQAS